MKIEYIKTIKVVKKTKEELEEEKSRAINRPIFFNQFKEVPLKKPIYIVEMTMEELQLVSFYLELERRKPIMNVKVDTKLKKESDK